jgi:hypothetical protein
MFIRSAAFKRLIKNSWKGAGICVGRTGQWIVIEGSYWQIMANKQIMKNTDIAAIVELIGELPEDGKAVIAIDKTENTEKECNIAGLKAFVSMAENGGDKFDLTRIIYVAGEKAGRVLQEQKTGDCVILNEDIIDMIDRNCIDRDMERYPEGPIAADSQGKVMVWTNGMMDLIVHTIMPAESYAEDVNSFLRLLENTKLERVES